MPPGLALTSIRTQQILGRLEALGIRLGLESMRGLLAALGSPELRFPAVLVAGSHGKGSTAALLAAMAGAAGYRTGLYTSPHLETVEERLRIDGRAVGGERLGDLLEEVVACAERRLGHSPTYFEAVTAAAFLWFAAEHVELAVVEVGLGRRLDATNVCGRLGPRERLGWPNRPPRDGAGAARAPDRTARTAPDSQPGAGGPRGRSAGGIGIPGARRAGSGGRRRRLPLARARRGGASSRRP